MPSLPTLCRTPTATLAFLPSLSRLGGCVDVCVYGLIIVYANGFFPEVTPHHRLIKFSSCENLAEKTFLIVMIFFSYLACRTCKKALVKERIGVELVDKCPRCDRVVANHEVFTDFIMSVVVEAG